jgi:hypothetical protein
MNAPTPSSAASTPPTSMTPATLRHEDPMTIRFEGPSPEVRISKDLARRGLYVAPAVVGIAALIWGANGAVSALFALGLVIVNFAGSAALISLAAKISLGMVLGATMFGYLIRLAVIFAAVWMVADAAWISIPALGATIIVSHLGLLIWELRYVALSLAHSGLRADNPITLDK